jgi:hypothetical protein
MYEQVNSHQNPLQLFKRACKTVGHDILAFGDGIVGAWWAAGRRRDPNGFAAVSTESVE